MINIESKYQIGDEVYFVSAEFYCKTKILDITKKEKYVYKDYKHPPKTVEYFEYKLDLSSPGLHCFLKNCVLNEYDAEDEFYDGYDDEFVEPDGFGWVCDEAIVRSEEEAIKYFEGCNKYWYCIKDVEENEM